MNIVTVTGNLGQDPKITTGKTEIMKFSIFVKGWGNSEGFWLNVTQFKPNDFLKDVLKKGTPVAITGRLDISEYDGKYWTNVIANNVDVFRGSGEESTTKTPKYATSAADYDDFDSDGNEAPF